MVQRNYQMQKGTISEWLDYGPFLFIETFPESFVFSNFSTIFINFKNLFFWKELMFSPYTANHIDVPVYPGNQQGGGTNLSRFLSTAVHACFSWLSYCSNSSQ